MINSPIYLDYAATTPVDQRVAETMHRYLTVDGRFGNAASSTHAFGREAATAVAAARAQVAALINARSPKEIIWTSGATESDNLGIKGVARGYRKKGVHIVTCSTEHKAVLDSCRALEQEGFEVTYVPPACSGVIELSTLAQALRRDTVLISIMHVNNETGVIQDIAAIGHLARERGVLFHVDAAQSAGKIPIDVQAQAVDLLSLSGHKIYGPKGVGALYVRSLPRVRLEALIHGGGQERGLRAGTLPVHQIAGMGEACHLAAVSLVQEQARLQSLRERLWIGLSRLGDVHINGNRNQSVAGILNVRFGSIDAAMLMDALQDVAVSAGSACSSATPEPSHVLRAIGVSDIQAHESIRFSIGRMTTDEEIDYAVERVSEAVQLLRSGCSDRGLDYRCPGDA